jgi:hypothetical protein
LEIDDSTAHTGSKSLKVVGIAATGIACHTKVRHEFAPAENDGIFTVSFWAKVDAEQGQSRNVEISIQSPDEEWPGFYSETIVLDSADWKEYTHTFALNAEDLLEEVRVGLCVAQSDVDFWIDDFRFFEDEQDEEIKEVAGDVISAGRFAVTWGGIKEQ